MENKASKIVSELVLGERFKTFVIGSKAYTMYSPTIRTIMKCTRELAQIDFSGDSLNDMLANSENMYHHATRAIAYAVIGSNNAAEDRVNAYAEKFKEGTITEISNALTLLLSMVSGEEVFLFATCVKKFAQVAAKMK